jgi:DNA-binding LytR/AlgR family response regulator
MLTAAIVVEELGDDAFCRVHRSVAVRRDAVRKLMPLGSGRYQLELIDGRNIISGRNYRDDVRTLLDGSADQRTGIGTAASWVPPSNN